MSRTIRNARGQQVRAASRHPWSLILGALLVLVQPHWTFCQERGMPGVPSSPVLPGPTMQGVAAPEVCLAAAAPGMWDIYVKAGPVCMLSNGFLEKKLGTGWTIRAGLQDPLGSLGGATVVFHELGTNYSTNSGNAPGVAIAGAFRGEEPADDHIHSFADLFTTRLDSLRRASFDYALGANHTLFAGQQLGGTLVQAGLRTGLRLGVADADYTKTVSADALTQIEEHLAPSHGHKRISMSTDGGRDPGFLFGLYTSIGVSVTIPNVNLWRGFPGQVTLGAEVEFAQEWMRLGDFSPHDNGLTTIIPMFSLAITF